jgi:uncharacterized metal-binding protein
MKCAICEDKICLKGEICKELEGINLKEENISHYLNSDEDSKILKVSDSIRKDISRLEEIASYVKLMGIKKVGLAFCKGLQNETKLIHEFFTEKGIDSYSIICGHAGIDKGELKLSKPNLEDFVVSCNPYGQANVLNNLETELNIAIGFCIGHDILFNKYSNAPITTFIVKDRVYKHCSIKALQK